MNERLSLAILLKIFLRSAHTKKKLVLSQWAFLLMAAGGFGFDTLLRSVCFQLIRQLPNSKCPCLVGTGELGKYDLKVNKLFKNCLIIQISINMQSFSGKFAFCHWPRIYAGGFEIMASAILCARFSESVDIIFYQSRLRHCAKTLQQESEKSAEM